MLRHTFRNPELAALAALAACTGAQMMAGVGTILPAKAFKISVATAALPTAFKPVSFQNTFDVSGDTNVGEFDVFDFDDPITFEGKLRRTLAVSGYLSTADDGVDILLAAAAGGLKVILKVLWDATPNGFTQECKVRNYRGGAKAGNNPDDISFEFAPTTALGTVIGAGPLL